MRGKIKTRISYRVMELSEDGTLVEPVRYCYGRKEWIFSHSYDTFEEAVEAIEKEHPESCADYCIIQNVERCI